LRPAGPDDIQATLVTGATGIAGWHIADELERRGMPVVRISRRPQARGHSADVTDPRAIELLPDFAGLVHCAGLTPRIGTTTWTEFHRANVMASTLLAEEAVRRRARFFVYISTGGRLGRRHSSRTVTRLYVISKYLAERRIREVLRGKVPALSLRAASLYGEHDNGSMARLIQGIGRGRFVLPTGGVVPKCLLYAGSLGTTVAEEIRPDRLRAWRAHAIADVRAYTLAEVVAAVEDAVGRRARRLPVSPRVMSLGIGPLESAGRLLRARPMIDLATGARTAFAPAPCRRDNLLLEHHGPHVALTEGVRREVEWMRASGAL
jgi:nucleoside-diphosphate-sugar epimerase